MLWVQGCSLHCPGCWNPDTWSRRPNRMVAPLDLAEAIVSTPQIEGLTLTGGEPFDQAAGLAPLAARVRGGGFSVMIFTGYELGELDHGRAPAPCWRTATSWWPAATGCRNARSRLPWRGSANQADALSHRPVRPGSMPACRRSARCHIAPDGSLTLTGFPPPALTENR